MTADAANEKKRLKNMGIINTKDPEIYAARVVTGNGVLTSDQLRCLANAAEQFGNGRVALTTRFSAEIQGVRPSGVEELRKYLQEYGLDTGGTGPRIRPVVACKGTVCTHGLMETQEFAREIHEKFYKAWYHVQLPHKFKIGIGGCPNNCAKPTLNDFGLVGHLVPKTDQREAYRGFRVYLGGYWGKRQHEGVPLPGVYSGEEALLLLENVLNLWILEGKPGERFGMYLQRTGEERFFKMLKERDPEDNRYRMGAGDTASPEAREG